MQCAFIVFCCLLSLGLTYSPITTKPNPLNCGSREVEACVHDCPPQKTCRNRGVMYRCAIPEHLKCQRKCVCKLGYYRNAIGECITGLECSQCSKPNEFYSCGSACDNECSTITSQNRTNCPIINIKCNEKCYCDDGYARNAKGNCVPVDQCGPTCAENEEYVLGKSCPPDHCIALVAKFKCDSNELDKYRCRCKSGYFRLNEGSPCAPICECPQMKNSPGCAK